MKIPWIIVVLAAAWQPAAAAAPEETIIRVDASEIHQAIDGMGCGAIFYEGHITSLAARKRDMEQDALYDAMFRDVPTDFLHLMIRHDHEPENDNSDPWVPAFKDEWFQYAEHTAAICAAARKRRPGIKLYATLYTPPAWMKTNHDVSAGGKARGTLRPGMELEFGEFCWAFLDRMHRHGHDIEYLSIANEPDWEHTQPGYWLTPEAHAGLFAACAAYLREMTRRHPGAPMPMLVAPNTLSAVDCANRWLPPLIARAPGDLAVVGTHDYDRRGDRWAILSKAAAGRPVWCTEWCVNGPDASPDLMRSATEYWLAMTEAFNGGANAWMAYDWVYPPRPGGEALIHVDWGSGHSLTKIYHGFRQWSLPLRPGMRVVRSSVTGPGASAFSMPGVKASSFLSADGRKLVIHAAAVQDADARISLDISAAPGRTVRRLRTSATENAAALPPLSLASGKLRDTIPGRSMMTWLIGFPEDWMTVRGR